MRAKPERDIDLFSSFIRWLCEGGFESLGMIAYFGALIATWIHTGSLIAGVFMALLCVVPIAIVLMIACLLFLFIAPLLSFIANALKARKPLATLLSRHPS